MIWRLGDTVCDPHCTCGGDEKRGVFGLTSKPVAMVYQWFGLKTNATISWFGAEKQGQRFGDLGFKITMTVSWFGPQNQGEEVCHFASQN
jgi:hypothetical protein